MVEPRRIKSIDMPADTPSNRSYEQELVYMRRLFGESPKKLCRYQVYKMFHYIRIFHEISLLVFSVDFIENSNSDWPAVDAKIFTVFSHRKELSSMPSKEDVIPPAEVIAKKLQAMQDEINQEIATKDGIAQVTFLTQKATEDAEFYKAVDKMAAEADSTDVPWLSKVPMKRPPDSSMKNEKFKEYVKFKQLLQKEFGEDNIYSAKMENKKKMSRMVDHTNKVFQQINPGMPKTLSAVVTAPNYTFDSAYKKYMLLPSKKIHASMEIGDDKSKSPFLTEDMRSMSGTRQQQQMKINLDSILEKQQSLMSQAISSSRHSPAKQASGLSFLNKKSRSMVPDNIQHVEDSVTNTGRSYFQASDLRSEVKQRAFLPMLALSHHKRSKSVSTDVVRKDEMVNALQQQIEVARERHRKGIQRRQHIIMSMKLSQSVPQKPEEDITTVKGLARDTKFEVGELKLADKLSCMKECNLDPDFWSWQPNLPETTGKPHMGSNNLGNTQARQMLRTRPNRNDIGLRLDKTNTRLKRTGQSDMKWRSNDKGYLMEFIM